MRRVGTTCTVAVCVLLAAVATALRAAPPAPELAEVRVHDVRAAGAIAWVARTAGLGVFDVSEPVAPREIGRLELPSTPVRVRLDGSRAYLAAGAGGLFVAGVADPAQPVLLGRYDPPGVVLDAVARGEHVWLATRRHGVEVVNLRQIERPLRIAGVGARGESVALALRGELLAVAEERAGVRLLDVSRPGNPREVRLLDGASGARDVAFAGEWLVAACGKDGVVAWRVPGEGLPGREPARRVELDGEATALFATGGRVAVALGAAGVALFDPAADSGPAGVALPDGIPVRRGAPLPDGLLLLALDRWGLGVVDAGGAGAPEVLLPRQRRMRVLFP